MVSKHLDLLGYSTPMPSFGPSAKRTNVVASLKIWRYLCTAPSHSQKNKSIGGASEPFKATKHQDLSQRTSFYHFHFHSILRRPLSTTSIHMLLLHHSLFHARHQGLLKPTTHSAAILQYNTKVPIVQWQRLN